jgi:hypothetical protein
VLHDIRLSWRSILLAPLAAPLILVSLLTLGSPGPNPILGFLLLLVLGCFVSYGATIVLLLPCLYLLSKVLTLRWYWACLCGTILGVVVIFPITWIAYRSSGPDSGPPVGTFLEFLRHGRTDPLNCLFPIAGGVTALAFWMLGSKPRAASEISTETFPSITRDAVPSSAP